MNASKNEGSKPRRRGPGLLELGVWVLALACALAAGAAVHARRITDEQRDIARARDMIRALMSALAPPDAEYALPSTEEGLQALVRRGVLPQVPDDPWGRPYVYRNPGKLRGIDLLSLGPDGVESADDLVAGDLYAKRETNAAAPGRQP